MIQLENIQFGYKKKKPLFTGLDMNVPTGSIYGLLGKNGAGKTTLLKIMAGLLFSKEGNAKINGKDPSKRMPELLNDLFLMPEEFYVPPVSIRKYVDIYAPFYPGFDFQLFETLLNEFEMNSRERLNALSYGQKKKFLISFGLATNASLCILDEPTNGLDIPSKSQFRRVIANFLDDERTIIISTHQVRDLESLIDHIVVLDEGKVIFSRNIAEVSEKLSFRMVKDSDEAEKIIYSEGFMGNQQGVVINEKGEDTRVDLELLFNAIVKDKSKINQVFN